jgi:hypothetical protein
MPVVMGEITFPETTDEAGPVMACLILAIHFRSTTMSAIHDQAMNYVYQQVLHRLLGYFSRAERTALQLFIQRLAIAAGGMERIGDYKVLVVQAGTRDSSYTLAFLRAAQLSIASRAPSTFNLRIATLRHAWMSPAAMANVHRSYGALFVYDDPRVEVLMLDERKVLPFDHLTPISDAGHERNRRNVLMSGHLSPDKKRSTFRDEYHLAMGDFYGVMTRWKGGVDTLVNGDSPREQRQYLSCFISAAQRTGLSAQGSSALDFDDLFRTLDEFGQDYYRELWAGDDQESLAAREAHRPVSYVGLHDLVGGNNEERWPLLNEFLGFQFDQLSSHVGESECASPLLLAHMRGLQAQFVRGSGYDEGVADYLQRFSVMMRKKNLPDKVVEQALHAYSSPDRIAERRALANAYTRQALGLNEAQLVCLLFSPFVNEGAGLEAFLRRCHPGMLVAMPELHKALQTRSAPEQVMQWMVDVSGLPVGVLGTLYRMRQVDIDDEASFDVNDSDQCREGLHILDSGDVATEKSAGR